MEEERGKPIPRPGIALCAGHLNRNTHGHVTRAILCVEI